MARPSTSRSTVIGSLPEMPPNSKSDNKNQDEEEDEPPEEATLLFELGFRVRSPIAPVPEQKGVGDARQDLKKMSHWIPLCHHPWRNRGCQCKSGKGMGVRPGDGGLSELPAQIMSARSRSPIRFDSAPSPPILAECGCGACKRLIS